MYVEPEPINVPSFGGRHQASNTWAWITRAQYKDYQQRFVPMEDELLNMTTYNNPALVAGELGKGRQAVNKAFDTARAQQDQHMSRYGAAISADQLRSRGRSANLGRSAAIVDAANRIRARLIDQNRDIALGAASTAAGTMEGVQ